MNNNVRSELRILALKLRDLRNFILIQKEYDKERFLKEIGEIKDKIQDIEMDEREKYDNLSEGLKMSERGDDIYNAFITLNDVVSTLEEISDTKEELIKTRINESLEYISEVTGDTGTAFEEKLLREPVKEQA